MRWLVFLLVIVNIVTFCWFVFNQNQHKQYMAQQERKAFDFSKVPKVTLLQELPKSELLSRDLRYLAEQKKQRRLSLATRRQCHLLGSFNSADTAKKARDILAYSAAEVRVIMLAEPLKIMYWLFIPPKASRSSAVVLSEKLKEEGINNFVLGDGDPQLQYALSLGLFSKLGSAQKELKRIELAGYKPEIIKKERKKEVYWLAFNAERSDKFAEIVLKSLRDLSPEIKNQEKSCQSIAELKAFQ